MQSVCVFCGSSSGTDPAYVDAATALGQLLAAQGLDAKGIESSVRARFADLLTAVAPLKAVV